MTELVDRMNEVLSALHLDAKCVRAELNRHLAFFDVETTRVRKLELFSREISMKLRSKTEPIIATIPKDGVVRFRFAMSDADIIPFEKLYNSTKAPKGILPFLLGESDEGKPLWVDMADNPHMLVAGSTGSGKSNLLHVLIANALKRNDLDLLLVDPKFGVEFSRYTNLAMVAKDYKETIVFLESLNEEMEYRYKLMANLGICSIEQDQDIFSKKLVIIDEVADLIVEDNKKDNPDRGRFEDLLCGIAQKARACGIYMVIATQRPSIDVITGLIKANFPARLACKVSTSTDSKVILDRVGAESLLGRGDAIINNSRNSYVRFQVAYVNLSTV
jgi:S-DNA-T family DNA segregation ATPase FtsK/SpoIIIE